MPRLLHLCALARFEGFRTFTRPFSIGAIMRILKFLSVIFLGATLLFAASCSQTEIGHIEGRWQLFYINQLDDPNFYVWEFGKDGEFTITLYPSFSDTVTLAPEVIGVGKYETSAEFLDAVVVISEVVTTSTHVYVQTSSCCSGEDKGAWTILKIDNEVLRIGTADAGGYVIREFTRVN